MAYRTYANDVQIFGNNEYYETWLDFIKKSGIQIGEDGNYDGYITNFPAAMRACEKIVMEIEAEREQDRKDIMKTLRPATTPEIKAAQKRLLEPYTSLFDLSRIKQELEEQEKRKNNIFTETLFGKLKTIIDNGYLFIPIILYNACKDDLELDIPSGIIGDYKLKQGRKIHVHAG